MNPISQLPQTVRNAPVQGTINKYKFERFSQGCYHSGTVHQPEGNQHWNMVGTELVTGHFHYTLTNLGEALATKNQVEVVVKAMPTSSEMCFLGLDPRERALSILFDGLQETTTGTIVRICLDNQQMDRASMQPAPGQAFKLWKLDDLQFSNYLVRIHMNGLINQQFLIQLIR